MTKMIDHEREVRALRVQELRKMTKLSRREFSKKTGIPNATLQHWEDTEKHTFPEKSAKRLIKAMLALGIHCSYQWLIYGKGHPPEFISSSPTITSTNLTHQAIESMDQQILLEIELFLRQSKDSTTFIVPDNSMEPRFVTGEIVGGIWQYGKNIQKLVGFECIVLVEGADVQLRTLLKGDIEGCFHLAHTNPKTTALKPFLYNVELVSAAPVIWSRRPPLL